MVSATIRTSGIGRDPIDRFRSDERRSRRPQAAARRDLRSRARARRARLGPADDDAAEGSRRPVRGLGDALRARPRALRLGRGRAAARRGGAARGGARPRLRRREPDPRHAARLGEGAPRPCRARRRLGARGREGARRVARGARGERLLDLPAGAPARARRGAPLGRVHGAGRLALRRLPRRVRARDEDGRGESRLRRASAGVDRDRPRRGRAGGRLLPRGRLPGRDPAGVPRRDPARLRLRGGRVPARPHRPPLRDVVLPHGHPDDDAVQADEPARALGRDARGGTRADLPGRRPRARAHAAVRERVARSRRVAEPLVGEPRRPLAPVLARPLPGAAAAASLSSSRSTWRPGTAASTASLPD